MTHPDFQISGQDGAARMGELVLARGKIRTPAFMPVGTAASVKALYMDQVEQAGSDIILGNTYHLMLRPGAERVARLGGLHAFSTWKKPILTDSGGFQVWSLSKLRKLSEKGVEFRSHIDGSKHFLSPERAIEIQADLLGTDISMQLDECTNFPSTHEEAEASMLLSLRWAERCRERFGDREEQSLFGIVQGGVYPDLRQQSAQTLKALDLDGYAIGGLAVGEGHTKMLEVLDFTAPHLPAEKPRYLMGVGKPLDIVEAVARGIDMFDCVLPTRSGRHGQAWTWDGPIILKNAQFAEDMAAINPQSDCPASRDYSKAYLNHLIKAGEPLGGMLLSWHNIAFYQELMATIRQKIATGQFQSFAADMRAKWKV